MMDPHLGGEGPAVLQLRKWGPSHPKLDLSEFREALISPTRQQLLLLSRHNEALLLPLLTDCGATDEVENNYSESVHYRGSASDPRRDDVPCISGSVIDFDNGFSFENHSKSERYPFVGDVHSVAWGVCGVTYNQHKDALFREFLFVSGNHGVTVHAFCEHNRNTATCGSSRTASQGEFEHGRWVEWGPSVTLVQDKNIEEPSSSFYETNGNGEDANTSNGNSESPQGDELKGGPDSKFWLQSFFTKVEDIESDGKRWTRFPEKSSFPCSAKVVSYDIFNSDFPFTDALSPSTSLLNQDYLKEKVHNSGVDPSVNLNLTSTGPSFEPNTLSSAFGVGTNSLYKCFRVFSSNSHYFVGFALTLVDPVSSDKSDESARSMYRNMVLVARLDNWGIQWVSLVKLEENQNIDPLVEWTDFRFSDSLLVCLTSSGFVVFYSAMSGEYVAHLNILQTCGLKPDLDFREQDKLSLGRVRKNIKVEKVLGRRVFNRLIPASHTSMLAAVDEYGVVYVICAGHCFVDGGHTCQKLLPHCQHLGLGMLAGWEVGGYSIGCQRLYSKFSGCHDSNFSSMGRGCVCFLNNDGNRVLKEIQHLNLHGKGTQQYKQCLSGFFAASEMTNQALHDAEMKLHLMRRIFLPTYRANEDDSFSFSPFGITRLIRKHKMKDQNGSQIVHVNLHTESGICDDSCLLIDSEMFLHKGRKEAFTGDAVGCTFQECFYLVTESGLSVVLPSISVSSSFLPITSIGYRQWSINSGSGNPGKDNLEIRESKWPCSPWTIEVLDRVLLYDSVEEADRLCLENGWNLKIPRMRRLQLALEYLKFDDIEQCLETLVGVNLAEGILRLLFAAVYLMLRKIGNDNDVSAASRLLALATRFATKMIRKYGLLQHDNDADVSNSLGLEVRCRPLLLPDKFPNEVESSRRLREMARFLEIIRNLQSRLSSKFKRPGQGVV